MIDGGAADPKSGQVFDHWTVRCEQPRGHEREQCVLFQNVVLRDSGQPVVHISVGYLPNSDFPIAILTLPLGISLPPGAGIQVDANEPVTFPIEHCEPRGCRAGFKISTTLLAELKAAETAQVSFHDGDRQPVHVTLSLKGFARGIESLR
jgi:invasion protein IalB